MNKWKELELFLESEDKRLSESLDDLSFDAPPIPFYSDVGSQTMALKILAFMKELDKKEKKQLKEKRQAMLEKKGISDAK